MKALGINGEHGLCRSSSQRVPLDDSEDGGHWRLRRGFERAARACWARPGLERTIRLRGYDLSNCSTLRLRLGSRSHNVAGKNWS